MTPASPGAAGAVDRAPATLPLRQLAITVSNVAEAATFYRDAIGLRQLDIPAPTLAFFDCGGVRLMLAPPEGRFTPGGAVAFFQVEDIERAYAERRARGVVFEDEPHAVAKLPDHELWLVSLRDPAGDTVALMAERRDTVSR
jgi:methylmalonyl-CoA/ethylmalonyl-CoA epimerase